MISKFEYFFRVVRSKNPNLSIFVSATLPRDVSLFSSEKIDLGFLDRCNARSRDVNADLRARNDIVFIDHHRFGSDKKSANRSLLSRDGLHLTGDGVNQLRQDFDFALRSICSLPPRFEKFSVSLAPPVFKYPLHERNSGLSDTEWPALPVSLDSRTSASFASFAMAVPLAKISDVKSVPWLCPLPKTYKITYYLRPCPCQDF